jgi:hypothetical protein
MIESPVVIKKSHIIKLDLSQENINKSKPVTNFGDQVAHFKRPDINEGIRLQTATPKSDLDA